MCAVLNSPSVETQSPLFCLHCSKLVILSPKLIFEASDHTGVFLGYLHKNCLAAWKQNNSSCTVQPLTKT
jgi:hypothetical protein